MRTSTTRRSCRHALLGLFVALLVPPFSVQAQTVFSVTTTADAGAGSLRQAITDANASAGADEVTFAIPGTGPHTIQPLSALPTITDPVTIDGLSQPGADCSAWPATLRIEIDGSAVEDGTSGVHLAAGSDGSTVRGLVIHSFLADASGDAGVFIDNSDNHIVECSYLGTDPTGTEGRPNVIGVRVVAGDGNRIGGPGPGQRNLISGNLLNIAVRGFEATGPPVGTVIQGNYVGTDASGASILEGTVVSSVSVQGAVGTLVGGVEAGAGNVIVGGTDHGLFVGSGPPDPATTGTVVQGNRIGTDASGTAALPNGRDGVFILNASGTLVGGPEEGARNLLSGNTSSGIVVFRGENGGGTSGNRIENNFVGTDASGLAALGNGFLGVFVAGSPGFEVIGTEIVGNVISANFRGVSVFPAATGTEIQGNYIGVGADGVAPLGNGSLGVELRGGETLVGGRSPAERNVIGSNGWAGVALRDTTATGNRVEGNYIGVGADGVTPRGQVPFDEVPGMGVTFINGAMGNVVGGEEPGAANVVAFNAGPGFRIIDPGTRANALRRNAVYQNEGAGIEFTGGVVPNDDGDGDDGPNNLQNFPEITSASGDGASTLTVTYSVPSATAHSAYPLTVEFFLADVDGTEGQTFVGSTVYEAADAEQQVSVAFSPISAVTDGSLLLATATDADGNTSAFSSAVEVAGGAVANEPEGAEPGLALSAVHPNPFSGRARFTLEAERPQRVTVAVYDVLGRRVAVLHDGPLAPGAHAFALEGRALGSGAYVLRVEGAGGTAARRVTVVR